MIGFVLKPFPDAPWKWPLIWSLTGFGALTAYALWRLFGTMGYGPVGLVLSAPVVGLAITHWLIEGGAMGISWLRWMPWAAWQGKYYGFEDHHLRVVEIDGELWFVDRDVLALLGLRKSSKLLTLYSGHEHARLAGTPWFGFSRAGIERLLSKSVHPLAKKLRYWFEREVYAPHAAKRQREREALYGAPVQPLPDVLPAPPAVASPPLTLAQHDLPRDDARKIY